MAPPRLRAPRDHQTILAVPPLDDAASLLSANRARLPASEIRQQAVRETLDAAERFHVELGLPVVHVSSESLVVTGHQPELFHPGVWVKNFALNKLARQHGLTPVHLIVDNDDAKATALRVPVVSGNQARTVAVAYDRWAGPAPYEELTVRDEGIFNALPAAVADVLPGGWQPLLPDYWRRAMALAPRTKNLGLRLAGARRLLEADWGCQNWELPLSRLCQTDVFASFACHLLGDLPRFHAIFQKTLHDYRQRHGIRSRSHPMPDLTRDGDWLEAPFWVWRPNASLRERLLVRATPTTIDLRWRDQVIIRLPRAKPQAAVEEWKTLEQQGFKVRTRAVTTTLFVRVFIADLFIHGIGGAIYDELTDAIMREFYGLEPPSFITLSATLLLPLSTPLSRTRTAGTIQTELRRLWYQPERCLESRSNGDDRLRGLMEAKRSWVERVPANHAEDVRRFKAILALNDELRPHVEPDLAVLRHELLDTRKQRRSLRVLKNREYAFCLHAAEELRQLMAQL